MRRVQQFVPVGRLRVERRHKRIQKLLEKFVGATNDARKPLRVVLSTLEDRALAYADAGP